MQTEPYFYTLQSMMARVMRHLPEDYTHPYLDLRESVENGQGTVAIICVTADKGLAGAYNHNVIRKTEELLAKNQNSRLFVVGEMGRSYFHTRNIPIEEAFHYTAQNPTLHRARVITRKMMGFFEEKAIDELHIVFTRMKNSLEMECEEVQLLPLDKLHPVFLKMPITANHESFNIFPSPDALIDNVIPDYINGYIYSALVEAFCAEQQARMTSMDAANRNGNELKQKLRIQYNRARQAQITQEITEIAAGAKAQKAAKKKDKK